MTELQLKHAAIELKDDHAAKVVLAATEVSMHRSSLIKQNSYVFFERALVFGRAIQYVRICSVFGRTYEECSKRWHPARFRQPSV